MPRFAVVALLALIWLPYSSFGAFVAHSLTDLAGQTLNFTDDMWAYTNMLFDPSGGPLGRVIILPARLRIDRGDCTPGPCNCSVSYSPDPSSM